MFDESFAKLFVGGNINTGDKYDNNNTPPRQNPQAPKANTRPQYDGGTKYRANGIDERIYRQLRREEPKEKIDLHGMTAANAITALEDFITTAQSGGVHIIEVIHGKGAGVLKPATRQWLAQSKSVLAFTEVNNNSGAIRVYLSK